MKIAVAGGTGLLGRMVVDALRDAGHEPVVLARSVGVDVVTGAGLDSAMVGVSRVVDVTNVTTNRRAAAVAFFDAATRALLAAGRTHGVEHHVALSIVGVDRVGVGYFQGKRRQEELVLADGIPGTVLRATQLHEFPRQLLDRTGRLPLALAPRMLIQPVAAREVADHLVSIATGEPLGRAVELAGPEPLQLTDMIRQLVRAQGRRRRVLPVRVPGPAGNAMATGGMLPSGPGPRGHQTFAEWLAATYGRPA